MSKLTLTTTDDAINLWLKKFHGITVAEVKEQHPEWTHREFYATYKVTQEQHDEWLSELIDTISRERRLSKETARHLLSFDLLNCSPSIVNN